MIGRFCQSDPLHPKLAPRLPYSVKQGFLVMKALFSLLLASFSLVSCVDYDTETRHDFRDRMVGRYEVEEFSDTYREYVYYNMYVSKDYGTRDGLVFDDFYAEDVRVYAYVNNDYIDIPFQITDGFEIEGHGTYYRGELQLNYSVKDRYSNSFTDYCETIAYAD